MSNMPSRKNRFNNSWSLGPPNPEPIGDSNVGRKLLEKMGWANGLGLGRDNQGMVENPLWKHRRDALCKTGFKSKDEMAAPEVLPHQHAFEDFLGELNTVTCQGGIESDRLLQTTPGLKGQNPKRRIRYPKMAHAKDISNYSLKDFEGIIGKEVTKKNIDLLCNDTNSGGILDVEEINDIYTVQMYPSYSGQNIMYKNTITFQKSVHQLYASEKKDAILEENKVCIYNTEERIQQNSDFSKPKKRKKHDSNPNGSGDCNVLDIAASEVLNSIAAEHVCNRPEKVGAQQAKVENLEMCSKKQKKKKKKRKKNLASSAIVNTDTPLKRTNIIVQPASFEEYLCNSKSVREIRQKEISHEEASASKSTPQFHACPTNQNEKSGHLNRTDTRTERNEHGCEGPVDIINNNVSTFIPRSNNNFLTYEERQEIKKHLAEHPEIVTQISDSFVGSNLSCIKGYGNW